MHRLINRPSAWFVILSETKKPHRRVRPDAWILATGGTHTITLTLNGHNATKPIPGVCKTDALQL